jgi:hypothetical protein
MFLAASLSADTNFQDPRSTPSWRKVWAWERKKEREILARAVLALCLQRRRVCPQEPTPPPLKKRKVLKITPPPPPSPGPKRFFVIFLSKFSPCQTILTTFRFFLQRGVCNAACTSLGPITLLLLIEATTFATQPVYNTTPHGQRTHFAWTKIWFHNKYRHFFKNICPEQAFNWSVHNTIYLLRLYSSSRSDSCHFLCLIILVNKELENM